jgi:hypothetical protein
MTPADSYRIKAARLMGAARFEQTPARRLEVEHLAASYRRLAEQVDRNSEIDVVYETRLVPRLHPQVRQRGTQSDGKE